MRFGEYPLEYDRAKHGPYDPARYYGKPDTPFAQVKLKDIPAWLGRRNKTPTAAAQAISRAWWRWNHKYVFPVHANLAAIAQLVIPISFYFWCIRYNMSQLHREKKYH